MTERESSGATAGREGSPEWNAGQGARSHDTPAPEAAFRPRRGFALGAGTGLVVIVLTLIVIGLALHRNLRAIDRLIERIIEVEEPTSAAAHELEINVLGTGLGVWKYLATGAAGHRERVDKDKSDFRRFRAEYERLATTPVEKDLGERLDALYEPYAGLSAEILDTRDAFVARLRRATEGFDAIDRIVDEWIQPGIEAAAADGAAKLLTSTAIEADAAECLASIAVYVADPAAGHREHVGAATAEVGDQVEAFLALELTPEERIQADDIRHRLDSAVAEIEQAVVLHEALQRDQEAFIALHERLDDLLDEGIQVLAREELGAAHPEAKSAVHRLYVGSMLVLALGAAVCIGAAGLLAYRSVQLDSANRELRREFARRRESEAARTLLLHELVSVQEQERGRLARELHDQMGQDLSTLLLGLKGLESPAPPGSETAAPPAELPHLQELTRRLIQQVHTIAWELRPAALDDLGVHGALNAYLEQWTQHSGVQADFESNLEGQRLPGPVEIALYRIAQEALTNVMKHAGARSVSLTLQRRGHEVVMVVEDDGAGFAPAQVLSPSAAGGRLGLLGMQERAALAGGALQVESAPGRGTTLVVRIPSS